ncbi:hypothetical protein [Yersinia pseudotuberculosis]|uniref:hypothetical protein n=1 Tax=Yersinia pseudotuberculosis TaxID=633 RepID=UPI001AA07B89|nr:hypothetical protein [Yersinia pseudotuberculosis]MBO1588493.1 hypothetical protein [Yersinia pseudotuberculosis]
MLNDRGVYDNFTDIPRRNIVIEIFWKHFELGFAVKALFIINNFDLSDYYTELNGGIEHWIVGELLDNNFDNTFEDMLVRKRIKEEKDKVSSILNPDNGECNDFRKRL